MSSLRVERPIVGLGSGTDRISTECTSTALPVRQDSDNRNPLSQNGCFEIDRVIKSGYARKRTRKTKAWKEVYLVLRPSTLSIYKNEKESKLRHQIRLTELTAVAQLTDPKHKHTNLFGLFTSSRNYHFEAPTKEDAAQWLHLIRRDARLEEAEEEMFLLSRSPEDLPNMRTDGAAPGWDGMMSSSPDVYGSPLPAFAAQGQQSLNIESSGLSGNELASHSDFSDNDTRQVNGNSLETWNTLGFDPPPLGTAELTEIDELGAASKQTGTPGNNTQDLDRIVWQGWLKLLRTKGGVRQWRRMWGVLRPRNLILYKDESEYIARWILDSSQIMNVVDVDPLSRSKKHCFQIITEEKSYRFCTRDEESLVRCVGAVKSLLAKRRGP